MEENKENVAEKPKVDDKVEKIKIKKKPKKFEKTPDIIKVDMSKPKENETKEDNTNNDGVVTELKNAEPVQKQEEVQPETKTQEAPVLEEITNEPPQPPKPELPKQPHLPENIQKVVDFMKDTGGDLNDYMNLNRDFNDYGDDDLLRSYYKDTKPHLDDDEINFLVQESFDWDEKIDDEKDVKRKKLALKEQVASAKAYLDGQKSKYYEEIKAGSKLTQEQQKAVDFFNRYNKESEATQKTVKKNTEIFTQKTNQVFNDKFKGFEYNVGDKKYRFNVNNAEEVKNTQSDISNFTKKFLDKNSALTDAKGYHKSLYTAMNADAVAKHFYEQGKADAMKDSVAKAKNVDMNPRQAHGKIEAGGLKVKVLGDNSSDFKFKIKNNK